MIIGQININLPPFFDTFNNIVNGLPITQTDGRITTELIELEKKEELEKNGEI
jgi:hypothetical protein